MWRVRKETKKKLRTEEKQTHDGLERCIMRGEGKRHREGERGLVQKKERKEKRELKIS